MVNKLYVSSINIIKLNKLISENFLDNDLAYRKSRNNRVQTTFSAKRAWHYAIFSLDILPIPQHNLTSYAEITVRTKHLIGVGAGPYAAKIRLFMRTKG